MNNMTFFGAIKSALINYFNFKGRARRSEYWWFTLLCYIITEIMGYIFISQIADSYASAEVAATAFVMFFISLIILLIPCISVSVRRLHDIGKSGWYLLIHFIPIVGPIVLFIWYCKDSQPGTNKWGENPKGVNENNNINEQNPTA